QSQLGVAMRGEILVSPGLDGLVRAYGSALSPLSFAVFLPSMAAANYERQGKPLTPQTMMEVEAYARTEYVTDLIKGTPDSAALERLVQRVATYTGLDPTLVRKSGGRIELPLFQRELYRDRGLVPSVYDSNLTLEDPFPWTRDLQATDPMLDLILAP